MIAFCFLIFLFAGEKFGKETPLCKAVTLLTMGSGGAVAVAGLEAGAGSEGLGSEIPETALSLDILNPGVRRAFCSLDPGTSAAILIYLLWSSLTSPVNL